MFPAGAAGTSSLAEATPKSIRRTRNEAWVSKTYSDGTTTNVKTVVTDRPKMMAMDMFCHH